MGQCCLSPFLAREARANKPVPTRECANKLLRLLLINLIRGSRTHRLRYLISRTPISCVLVSHSSLWLTGMATTNTLMRLLVYCIGSYWLLAYTAIFYTSSL